MIGYIYRLICEQTNKVYYGSTVDPIKRIRQHRSINNTCTSRNLINPRMELLECISIDDLDTFKKELLLIEKHYIKNNDCINKVVPLRTRKEYYKDRIRENPDYLKELYVKQGGVERNRRTKKMCACGGEYIQRNKKIHERSQKHQKYIEELNEKN